MPKVVDYVRGHLHHLPVALGQNPPVEQDDDTTGSLLAGVVENRLESLRIPAGRSRVNPLPLSGIGREIQFLARLWRGRLFNLRSDITTSQQKHSCQKTQQKKAAFPYEAVAKWNPPVRDLSFPLAPARGSDRFSWRQAPRLFIFRPSNPENPEVGSPLPGTVWPVSRRNSE